jgi:hypothetical protein
LFVCSLPWWCWGQTQGLSMPALLH